MTPAATAVPLRAEGTLRARERIAVAALLAATRLLQHLPEVALYRVAAAIGTLVWLAMPARRALVRSNLLRVSQFLAQSGRGSAQVRRAATSNRALDALTRSAFQHWIRTYVESAVAGRYSREDLLTRVHLETPEVATDALGPKWDAHRGRILVGFHFGAVELAALYAARIGDEPVSGPMESVENPVMRTYFERTREKLGINILPLDDAATALTTRLGSGETVALVADRMIRGAGTRVRLFGATARLPLGPAVLTVESGAHTYVVGMWRTDWNRWSARLDRLEVPELASRRERIRATLDVEARLLESMIANAPEQWWSVFFPIWERE